MEKRLKLAKKLLNPADSVLIVTIDEKEYHHLACLIEDLFSDARIQMVSSIINPKGVSSQSGFKRADEYIFFVMIGIASPCLLPLGNEWSASALKVSSNKKSTQKMIEIGWTSMMRRGSHSSRKERPRLYYAIYVNPETRKIVEIGEPLPLSLHKDKEIEGLIQVLPLRTNGEEGCWQVSPSELKIRLEQGRIRLGKQTSYGYVINYIAQGEYNSILSGEYEVIGKAEDGSLIAYLKDRNSISSWIAPTQWKIASHDASAYGSTLLNSVLV